MNQKYILTKAGEIRIGRTENHADLCKDPSNIQAGGWWHTDDDRKIIWLYGASTEFGAPLQEDLVKGWCRRRDLKDYEWRHSYQVQLLDAVIDGVIIFTSDF